MPLTWIWLTIALNLWNMLINNIKLTLANKITLFRILSVPVFIAVILYYSVEKDYLRFVALGIFLLAAVSDVLDGYIARTQHQKTKAGAILDGLADKLLLNSAFICLFLVGHSFQLVSLPMWLVVAVISRDVILILGVTIFHVCHHEMSIEVTALGKASSFFQIICVLGVLLQVPVTFVFWYVALFFTVSSGIDYVFKGIKILNSQAPK